MFVRSYRLPVLVLVTALVAVASVLVAPPHAASAASAAVSTQHHGRSHGLRIVVHDTVKGARPKVLVRGPNGFRRTVRRTTTFKHVRPGTYRVVAKPVKTTAGTAHPTVTSRRVRVTRSGGASTAVTYATLISKHTKVISPDHVARAWGPLFSLTSSPTGRRDTRLPARAVISSYVELQGSGQYKTYKPGDIFVSPPGSGSSTGMLVKVVRKTGSTGPFTTYAVEAATLPEAIPDGSIDGTLSFSLTKSFSTNDKGTPASSASKSSCTASARAQVDATFGGTASLKVEGDWSTARPTSSSLRVTASASATAKLDALATAAASCTTGERRLGSPIRLRPVTLSIFGVPVVIQPTLTLLADATAKASAKASLTVGGSVSTGASLSATLGGKVSTSVSKPKPTLTVSSTSLGSAQGTITATASVRLEADFYGLAGPYAQLNVGPRITLTPNANPLFSVEGDLSLDVGLAFEKCASVWGAKLCASFDAQRPGLVQKTWQIYPVGKIVFTDAPGTDAPPATLGSYRMRAFGPDPQGIGTVSSVSAPGGGSIRFSPKVQHGIATQNWLTWSHGYQGDVYDSDNSHSITIRLPSGTKAFYLYVEPNEFEDYDVTAVANSGITSGHQTVQGDSGATYFGFYATSGTTLSDITVSASDELAVGEFGIAR